MPKVITRQPNVGRSFQNAPTAKSGTSPNSLGSSAMNQNSDSGGGTVQPVGKPIAGLNAGATQIPVTGTGGKVRSSYPGHNVAAVGHPSVSSPGAGLTNKKVAGIAKFYGK